ncbi:NAD(P)/FAD-dependent oxidoreductase [Agromyces atrinae]|uniref:3-phenylpropionate/trans-cinnamate dioxygenase ferredoxin reductase subunit n=1 Tax=Agromyces atrinae TaxID=592376 RepID=A0A4Q2M460_9MICO|nr:FAD-dependent oxidoreductase [Agromyces atrinae]NYD68632.1 3-phenylpropionate/trans-cinnamate dioxygenase ferredoxin reductase subunit [Agromyces atrinae]RXZ86007.1 NAD(P)/FAD-dependent oxidoreductase [Agromyces atrinae]
MAAHERIIVIGGGLAAARAVEGIRAAHWTGPVTVVTDEDRPPYERPPLSKGYLLGSEEAAATIVHDADWYAQNDVDLRVGETVTALHPADHEVAIGDERLAYSKLLLTTGAEPRRFDGPGAGLTGVYHLRTLHDSTVLRTALKDGGRRVVVIGAGWIGLETAAAAREYGNEVTVIGRGEVPLASVLGTELGGMFADLHREHGVDVRMGSAVSALKGTRHVEAVVLGSGDEIAADIVIVGLGAVPRTELAAAASLHVDNGIVTDSSFRTSDRDIYAAGDVANVYHPLLGHHLRVEHWETARAAGFAAGRSLAGEAVEYDEIPYFFTDQYDLGMEYAGFGERTAGATLVYRGDRAAREFVVFWLRDSRVVAGMNVNVWDVNEQIRALIRSGDRVDPILLADADIPLDAVVA